MNRLGSCKTIIVKEEAPLPIASSTGDKINHPSHYKGNKLEVIDIIEDFGLGFNLGNAIKYILRAGKKSHEEFKIDLSKAIWYINREIEFTDREGY